MPVFNYALKRILTSLSTYIILGIFTLIPLMITFFVQPKNDGILEVEAIAEILTTISWLSSWFFLSFFLATIISKVISEEISDGSFLLIISKPLSRTRILLEKLLAITIISFLGFFISFFTPILGSMIVAKNNELLFQCLQKHKFWLLFYGGLLIILIVISSFSILAIYFSPRGISTIISLFITLLFAINLILGITLKIHLKDVLMKVYVYVPIIFFSIFSLPINWYLFKHKSFD